jgi:hypothetical protein
MMATILKGRLERLEGMEVMEAAVYRAALTWAPVGKKASEARGRLTAAQARAAAAEVDFNHVLQDIGRRDPQLSADFGRLGVDELTRAGVGPGGGELVRGALDAADAVRKARAELSEAQQVASETQAASAGGWRDVLLAFDELRERASLEVARAVGDVIGGAGAVPPGDVEGLAAASASRLRSLGVKV